MSSSTQRRDLVERAVEVVVGQADRLEPAGRRLGRALSAVARDVDPVAGLVPAAHGLDRVRVGHAGLDVLVGVRLLDAVDERIALERRDAPVALLLVGQVDAVALARHSLEQVPVVVQRGIDVYRDLGHRRSAARSLYRASTALVLPLRAMARVFASAARPTTPWRARDADGDYGVTAEPDWRDVDWAAHLHQVEIHGSHRQLRRHRLGRRRARGVRPRPRRPVAELAREHPAGRPGATRGRARPARLRHVRDAAGRRSRSRTTRAAWRRSASTSTSVRSPSSATRWAASSPSELAIRYPGAGEAARARLGRRNQQRQRVSRSGATRRADRRGRDRLHSCPPSPDGRPPGDATLRRFRWWRATRADWPRTSPGRG